MTPETRRALGLGALAATLHGVMRDLTMMHAFERLIPEPERKMLSEAIERVRAVELMIQAIAGMQP